MVFVIDWIKKGIELICGLYNSVVSLLSGSYTIPGVGTFSFWALAAFVVSSLFFVYIIAVVVKFAVGN